MQKKLYNAEKEIKKLKQELAKKQAYIDNFYNFSKGFLYNGFSSNNLMPIFETEHSANINFNDSKFLIEKDEDFLQHDNFIKNVVNNIPAVVWFAKFDSNYRCKQFYISSKIEQITGIKAEEIINKPGKWLRLIPIQDRKQLKKIIQDNKTQKASITAKYRLKTPKKGVVWLNDKVNITCYKNKSYKLFGIITNITNSDTENKKISERQKQFLALTMRLPIALYRSTADGRILFANNAFLKLIECPDFKQLNGILAQQLYLDSKDREIHFEQWKDGKKVVKAEYKIKTLTGKIKWVKDTAHYIVTKDKNSVFYEGFIEDITKEKLLENKLTRKQFFLENLINSIPLNIYAKSAIGLRFELWNKSCEKCFGFSQIEAIGKTSIQLFGNIVGNRFTDEDYIILKQNKTMVFEEKLKTKFGLRWFKTTKAPVRTLEGNPLYVLGISEDITAQKLAEKKAVETERRLKNLVESTHDMFGIYTPNGDCLYYYGPNWKETNATNIAGKNLQNINPKKIALNYFKQIKKCYTFKQNISSESQLTINGNIEYYSDAFYPIYDKNLNVITIGHIGHNISDSKNSKHLLLKYLKRLRNIQEFENKVMQQNTLLDIANVTLKELVDLIEFDLARICIVHPDNEKLIVLTWQSNTNFEYDIYNEKAPYPNFLPNLINQNLVYDSKDFLDSIFYKAGINSFYTIPLMHQNKIFAAVQLFSKKTMAFDEFYQNIGEDIGYFLSLAMYKAKLNEQTHNDAAIKEILISEINHRVKNNLASIIGLLYAQLNHAEKSKKEIYKEVIDNTTNRIRGLATVHDLLSAKKWNPIPVIELLKKVALNCIDLTAKNVYIKLNVTGSNVKMASRYLHSLALICNELVTNMCKYSFKNQQEGIININLIINDGLKIKFTDNGIGYPEEILKTKQGNVGLYLVTNLVKFDLKGEIKIFNNNGANTLVQLPKSTFEEEL